MNFKPECRMCHEPLKEYGGLLFSPPTEMMGNEIGQVVKSHICVQCYELITNFIGEGVKT